MTLDQLKKGECATVVAINASSELKNRFYSFGIVKGVNVVAEEHTLAKKTIGIRVDRSQIALRISEAEKVEIRQ